MNALANLAINDSGFAFNPNTGDSFVLNTSTIEIIGFIKQGLDITAISERMAEIYDIKPSEAYVDILDIMAKFKLYGLIS
jgi:hypothetical protein